MYISIYICIYIYACVCVYYIQTLDFCTLPTQNAISSPKKTNTKQKSCQMSNSLLGGIPHARKAVNISKLAEKSLGMPWL